jgi:GGDEF domain-containing protein
VVGRLGGDEFVIIYPELSVAAAGEAIERLRTALDEAVAAG